MQIKSFLAEKSKLIGFLKFIPQALQNHSFIEYTLLFFYINLLNYEH